MFVFLLHPQNSFTMGRYFQNVANLINSLFFTASEVFGEKPVYNKDFIEKFTTPEDRKKLNDAVQELKRTGSEKSIITLSNNEKITIVVK